MKVYAEIEINPAFVKGETADSYLEYLTSAYLKDRGVEFQQAVVANDNNNREAYCDYLMGWAFQNRSEYSKGSPLAYEAWKQSTCRVDPVADKEVFIPEIGGYWRSAAQTVINGETFHLMVSDDGFDGNTIIVDKNGKVVLDESKGDYELPKDVVQNAEFREGGAFKQCIVPYGTGDVTLELDWYTCKVPCLPDPKVTVDEMHEYGYRWYGMLPISKEKAVQFHELKLPVFKLYADNTEAQADGVQDILNHKGMFGIEKGAWKHHLEEFAKKM